MVQEFSRKKYKLVYGALPFSTPSPSRLAPLPSGNCCPSLSLRYSSRGRGPASTQGSDLPPATRSIQQMLAKCTQFVLSFKTTYMFYLYAFIRSSLYMLICCMCVCRCTCRCIYIYTCTHTYFFILLYGSIMFHSVNLS